MTTLTNAYKSLHATRTTELTPITSNIQVDTHFSTLIYFQLVCVWWFFELKMTPLEGQGREIDMK